MGVETVLIGSALLSTYSASKNRAAASRAASQGNALAAQNMAMQNKIMEKQLKFQKNKQPNLKHRKTYIETWILLIHMKMLETNFQ